MPLLGAEPGRVGFYTGMITGTVLNGLMVSTAGYLSTLEEEEIRKGAWIFMALSCAVTGGFAYKRWKIDQHPISETLFFLVNGALSVASIAFSIIGSTR